MSEQNHAGGEKQRTTQDRENLLKVSQVSKATGVSTSAINYYVRIGLLPPPLKTHKNMAFYDPSYIQMISYIKRLQAQKNLPLDKIREIMDRKIKIWREMDRVAPGKREELFLPEVRGRSGDLRGRIREAGMRLFSSKGYHAIDESDIFAQAGVSAWQFHEFYAGKEDLLLDIAGEAVRLFQRRVSGEISGVTDMLERIRIAIPVAFQVMVENREIFTLYLEESVLSDLSYERRLMQITASIAEDLKATIARGMKEGTIRRLQPDIAASAIIGQLIRLANYWAQEPGRHDMEEITREAVEFVTRALKP